MKTMIKRVFSMALTLATAIALAVPAKASDMGKMGARVTASCGEHYMAAIKADGSLWTWGNDNGGTLGDGTWKSRSTPVEILDNVASISCGENHMAAIKTDGSLWTWGNNTSGQVGDNTAGHTNNRYTPTNVLDNVASVSCGGGHTAAIKIDGSLWTWGGNSHGELGDGTTENHSTPVKVLDNVMAISCGGSHTAAIKTDGSLWTWGCNNFGQLGDGRVLSNMVPCATPIEILDNVVMVSTGSWHTAAIKTDCSLWTWGNNKYGELGDGTSNNQSTPVKVLDNVIAVNAGSYYTAAIKADGSLWMWGYNNSGQLGDGTTENRNTPVKVLDNVMAISCGGSHTAAIKTDGSLWTWGSNLRGELGDGTTGSHTTPVKIMDGVMLPSGANSAQTDYIYDTTDPGESVTLNTNALNNVTDTASAASAVATQTQSMTSEQKVSPTGADLATLYAETAVSKAASKTVSGSEILINKAAVTELETIAKQTNEAVESALVSGGVSTARYLSNTVTLKTEETGEIAIKIAPDILETEVDKIVVETPTYAITLKVDDLKEDLTQIVTITAQNVGSGFAPGNTNKKTTVKVNLPNGKTTNPVTLSLPTDSADTAYQAVVNTSGAATSSKYNPATTTMDGKVNTSGSYTVQTNQKDFSDIANKSAEMQKAIRYLASKGIINGTDATHFSPDGSITRAEIAALMVRALGKVDNSAKPTFKDVTPSNWFYATAASSQKAGLINGYDDNTFRGNNQINKEQIVAVSARVLTKQMGYKAPSNPSSYLGRYTDSVVSWAQSDVALATRENLVVYRTDGTFSGSKGMTRGDAAIIIYRLFQRIW